MPQPIEYQFSRLCEEFPNHLPSELAAEMERLPDGFLFRLIECRIYGHGFAQLRAANGDHRKVADTPMLRLIKRHELELAAAKMGITLPDDDE